MRLILAVLLAIGAGPALAQDTLADIRADLATLNAEVARLRSELSGSGGSNIGVSGGVLDRVNAIEAELQRVTAKTEELEFRINRVVEDGTNRIGDLEFRIVELEGGDVGALGQTAPLGGGEAPVVAAPVPTPLPAGTGELAITEEQDFRRAQEALASGDFRGAADLFAAFREAYPGSPLEPQVLLGQGRALDQAGDVKSAARAYLDAYSRYKDAAAAPEALFRLGAALGALGQTQAACQTLGEVANAYPASPQVTDAAAAMSDLGCS